MECNANLNSDIIFEILSRSSMKTVAKCRLLSREFNRISHESSFINLHCQRTKTLLGFFMQTIKYNKYYSTFVSIQNSAPNYSLSLDFLPVPVKIEASSVQGIMVCVGRGPRNWRVPRYYVCKPSTKEWEKIPNPKTRYDTRGIGIMVLRSNPLHYKIVRFSHQSQLSNYKHNYVRCEIFNSISRRWKQLQEVKFAYGECLTFYAPAVSASGNLHWLTTDNNILAFDVKDESYSIFSIPSSVYGFKYCHALLTDYEGKLGVMFMKRERSFMELWVLEIYDQRVWCKREKISVESLRKVEPYAYPVGFYNSDIALMKGFYEIIFFKFKNGISTDVVKLKNEFQNAEIFQIRPDFELSNLNNEFLKKKDRSKPWKEYISQFIGHLSSILSPTFVLLLLSYSLVFLCFTLDL